MTQRANYMKQSPDLLKQFVEFSNGVHQSSIERSTADLVTVRASQLNGCAFCVDMHVKEAKLHGERELRLHHLAVWHESPLFSARERAALEWTETLTRLHRGGVPDEVYDRVHAQLSEKEMSDLTFLVMSINGWNRASIAFKSVPGAFDKAYGLDKANLS
jgi:AhpD family alkylhydroperoxidase